MNYNSLLLCVARDIEMGSRVTPVGVNTTRERDCHHFMYASASEMLRSHAIGIKSRECVAHSNCASSSSMRAFSATFSCCTLRYAYIHLLISSRPICERFLCFSSPLPSSCVRFGSGVASHTTRSPCPLLSCRTSIASTVSRSPCG